MSAFMRAQKQQRDDEEPDKLPVDQSRGTLCEPVIQLDKDTYVILFTSKFNRASLAGVFQAQCLFGAVDISNYTLIAQHDAPATVRHLQKQTFRQQPSRMMTIATEAETPVVVELLWDVQAQAETAVQPPAQRPDVPSSKRLVDAINDLVAFAIADGSSKDKVALLQIVFEKQEQLFTTSVQPAPANSSFARSALQEPPPTKRGKRVRRLPAWNWQPRQSPLVIGRDWAAHATTFTKLHKRWVKRQRSVSDGASLPRWPSAMVLGAKGVGKSTFARYMCNKYASAHPWGGYIS